MNTAVITQSSRANPRSTKKIYKSAERPYILFLHGREQLALQMADLCPAIGAEVLAVLTETSFSL